MLAPVPSIRIRVRSDRPLNPSGDYVLYWMLMYRRPAWNFALDRALELCRELKKPLLVFEGIRTQYSWASDRLHRFILDGMRANRAAFEKSPVAYFPYVETEPDRGKGMVRALAARAAAVVTDDFPAFMIPHMTEAAARQIPCRFEQVDSNGILPMRAAEPVFPTAYAFRRFLQKTLPEHLLTAPAARPLKGLKLPVLKSLPADVLKKWKPAAPEMLAGGREFLRTLPIEHGVSATPFEGGFVEAGNVLDTFIGRRLARYGEDRSEPEKEGGSGLSPYLHFGHISSHEIVARVLEDGRWSPQRLAPKSNGSKEGWWGLPAPHESFLDELVTWRELGFNFCSKRDDYDRYESLPSWALKSLEKHRKDRRAFVYSLEQFERAQTHDPLWNAAQMQLVTEGRMHNYLRMLWGKKILEWSETPEAALLVMIELNNKYALDGRNPNSYSGIFWTLGRYDRPWAPERPVFGVVRYMSSENTARKFRVKDYLRRYSPEAGGQGKLV